MADSGISIDSVLNLDVQSAQQQLTAVGKTPIAVNLQVGAAMVRQQVESSLASPFNINVSSTIVANRLQFVTQEIGKTFAKELKEGLKEIKVKDNKGGIFGGLFNLAASPIKAVTRGFQEGIGITAASKIFSGTMKGIEGQYNIAFDKIGEKTGTLLGKTGANIADFTLKSVGTSSNQVLSTFEKLSTAWDEIWDAKKAEQQIDKIAESINQLFSDIIHKKSSITLKTDLQDIGEEIKRYKGLAHEGIDKRKQASIIESAKKAEEISKGIEVGQTDKKGVVIVGSGFGKKKNAESNAQQLGEYLHGLVGHIAEIVPVANKEIGTSVDTGENTPLWVAEIVGKIAQFNIIGKENADAIQAAAMAIAIRRDNPDVPISVIGHSAGGAVAEEVVAMLKHAGLDNVSGVGVGTPRGVFADPGAEDKYRAFLGEYDPIKQLTDIGSAVGVTQSSPVADQNLKDFLGHDFVDYIAHPDVQKAIFSSVGVEDTKHVGKEDILKNIGIDATEYSRQAEQQKIDLNRLSEAYKAVTDIFNNTTAKAKEDPSQAINKEQQGKATLLEQKFNQNADEYQRISAKLSGGNLPPGTLREQGSTEELAKLLQKIQGDAQELKSFVNEAESSIAAPLMLIDLFYKGLENKFDDEVKGVVKFTNIIEKLKEEIKNTTKVDLSHVEAKVDPDAKAQLKWNKSDVAISSEAAKAVGSGGIDVHKTVSTMVEKLLQTQNIKASQDQVKGITRKVAESQGAKDPRFAEVGLDLEQIRPIIEKTYKDYLDNSIEDFKKEIESKLKSLPMDTSSLSVDEIKTIFKSFGSDSLKDNLKTFRQALQEGNGEIAREVGEALLKQIQTAKILTSEFSSRLDKDGREYINSLSGKSSKGALTNMETEVLQGTQQKGRSRTGLLTSESVLDTAINQFIDAIRNGSEDVVKSIQSKNLEDAVAEVFTSIQSQKSITTEELEISQKYVAKLTAIVASLSGLEISKENIPSVENVNKASLTAAGAYEGRANQLFLPPELLKKIAQKAELSIAEIDTLIHELTHGAQEGFGTAQKREERLTTSDQELLDAAQRSTEHYARSMTGGKHGVSDVPENLKNDVQSVSEKEIDAQVFSSKYSNQIKELLLLIENIDEKGIKASHDIEKAFNQIFPEITSNIAKNWENVTKDIKDNVVDIQQFTDKKGYEIQKNLSEGSPGITKNIREHWQYTVTFLKARINDLGTVSHEVGKEIESQINKTPKRVDQGIKAVQKDAAHVFNESVYGSRQYLENRNRPPKNVQNLPEQQGARISNEFIEDTRAILQAAIALQKDVIKTGTMLAAGGVYKYLPDIKQFFKLISIVPEEIIKAIPTTRNLDVNRIRGQVRSVVDNIRDGASSNGLVQAAHRVREEAVSISKLTLAIGQELSRVIPGFDTLNNIFQELTGSSINMGSAFKYLVAGFAAYQLFNVIQQNVELFKSVIESAIAFESLQKSIEFTSGSAEKGARSLKFITDEAARLKVNVQSAVKGYQQLSASAQGNPKLQALVNDTASAIFQSGRALNLPTEQLDRAITAMSQMAAKGVISQEELRGQLSEAIPNALQIASRAFGVTTTELNKMVEEGINADVFLAKFSAQLKRETFFAAIEGADTLGASLTNLQNQAFLARNALGQEFAGSAKTGMDALGKILQVVADNAGLITTALQIGVLGGGVLLFNLAKGLFPWILTQLGKVNEFLGITSSLTRLIRVESNDLTPNFTRMGLSAQRLQGILTPVVGLVQKIRGAYSLGNAPIAQLPTPSVPTQPLPNAPFPSTANLTRGIRNPTAAPLQIPVKVGFVGNVKEQLTNFKNGIVSIINSFPALKGLDQGLGDFLYKSKKAMGELKNFPSNPLQSLNRSLGQFGSIGDPKKILNNLDQGVKNFYRTLGTDIEQTKFGKGLKTIGKGAFEGFKVVNQLGGAIAGFALQFIAFDAAFKLFDTVTKARSEISKLNAELAKLDIALNLTLVSSGKGNISNQIEARKKALLDEQNWVTKTLNAVSYINKLSPIAIVEQLRGKEAPLPEWLRGGKTINQALLDRQVEIDNQQITEANSKLIDYGNILEQSKGGKVSGESVSKAIDAAQARLDALRNVAPTTVSGIENLNNTINSTEKLIIQLKKEEEQLLGLTNVYGDLGKARIRSIKAAEDAETKSIAFIDQQTRNGVITVEESETLKLKAKLKRIDSDIAANKLFLSQLPPNTEVKDKSKIETKLNELTKEGFDIRSQIRQKEFAEIDKLAAATISKATIAEQERQTQITESEKAGVLNKEESEKLKASSTIDRIKDELEAEEDKITAIKNLDGSATDKEEQLNAARQSRNSKVLELLNAQISKQEELKTKVEQTEERVKKYADLEIAKRDKILEVQEKQIDFDQQRLDIVGKISDRVKDLEQSRYDFNKTSTDAQTSFLDLQKQQLTRALEIKRQLTGEDATNLSNGQRKALVEELATLGVSGKKTELQLINEIAAIERETSAAKLESVQKEFELKRKMLEFEAQRAELESTKTVLGIKKEQLTTRGQITKGENRISAIDAEISQTNEKIAKTGSVAEKQKYQDKIDELTAEKEGIYAEIGIANRQLQLSSQLLTEEIKHKENLREINDLKREGLAIEEKTAIATERVNQNTAANQRKNEAAAAGRDEISFIERERKKQIKEAEAAAKPDKEGQKALQDRIAEINKEADAKVAAERAKINRGNNIEDAKGINPVIPGRTGLKTPPSTFRSPYDAIYDGVQQGKPAPYVAQILPNVLGYDNGVQKPHPSILSNAQPLPFPTQLKVDLGDIKGQLIAIAAHLSKVKGNTVTANVEVATSDNSEMLRQLSNVIKDSVAVAYNY